MCDREICFIRLKDPPESQSPVSGKFSYENRKKGKTTWKRLLLDLLVTFFQNLIRII